MACGEQRPKIPLPTPHQDPTHLDGLDSPAFLKTCTHLRLGHVLWGLRLHGQVTNVPVSGLRAGQQPSSVDPGATPDGDFGAFRQAILCREPRGGPPRLWRDSACQTLGLPSPPPTAQALTAAGPSTWTTRDTLSCLDLQKGTGRGRSCGTCLGKSAMKQRAEPTEQSEEA